MILNDVHQGIQKNKPRKRIGRGPGSGTGRTATRGNKGDGSRSGYSERNSFEGGQSRFFMRVAKRGFNNRFHAPRVAIVNLAAIEAAFPAGAQVDRAALESAGLLKGLFDEVKILGNGTLSKALHVTADRFSMSAESKIKAAGGTVTHAPPRN